VSTTRLPARLKDVAQLAGVSMKTVSNVVNHYPYVRPATRRKVQEAIEELGYRPNLTARSLRSGRSGVIALAVPELASPYFAELAHHVVGAAMEHNLTVLVDETGQINDQALRDRERSAAGGIRKHLVDGVILSPLALDESDVTRYGALPLVLLGERLTFHAADHVGIDNSAAAADATQHLIASGRRRVGAIGPQPPPYGQSARLREQGYRRALVEAGVGYRDSLVAPAPDWTRRMGRDAIRQLMSRPDPPDAVFCFNDLLALGAIRGLADLGIRVPDDVAVAGFDNIEEGRYSVPTLSTISPDTSGIARQAVARLTRQLDDPQGWEPEAIRVGYTVEVRASSGG
jgi:DNA-binding LacI/PurR family transcriptional regulator